jgi:PGF-pre-PGF domain-containing protein
MNFTQASGSGGYYNLTFLSSAFTDGMYNVTVYANDSLGNLNNSQKIQFTIDNTIPTGSYTCSPASTTQGQTVTCTCTPTDALSGINSSTVSPASAYAPDTATTGTYTPNCTYYDLAGNFGSASGSYTINVIGVSSSTTTTGTTTPTSSEGKTSTVYTTVYANTPSTITNFDSSIGVEQIKLEVNSTSYTVRVSVTKYDTKPSAVSISKSGNVYSYLQIDTANLVNNLKLATVEIKVNKTWLTQNSISKDNIAVFRYNNLSSSWNELPTTYLSESNNYYYYTIELTGFSYFAIAQTSSQTTTAGTGENTTTTVPSGENTTSYNGLWITLGILLLAGLIVGAVLILKKIKR